MSDVQKAEGRLITIPKAAENDNLTNPRARSGPMFVVRKGRIPGYKRGKKVSSPIKDQRKREEWLVLLLLENMSEGNRTKKEGEDKNRGVGKGQPGQNLFAIRGLGKVRGSTSKNMGGWAKF